MAKVSKTGYKRNSTDKNEPALVIPSNEITMKDVDFPVFGTDNMGYSQMMYPGMDYTFPGDFVYEIPMAQRGGDPSIPDLSNKGWLSKYQKGGTKPPLYVDSKTDPRYLAYQDSLWLYENNLKPADYDLPKNQTYNIGSYKAYDLPYEINKSTSKKPSRNAEKVWSSIHSQHFSPYKVDGVPTNEPIAYDLVEYRYKPKSIYNPVSGKMSGFYGFGEDRNDDLVFYGEAARYKKPTQEVKLKGEEDALLKKAKAMGWPTVEAYKDSGWKKGPSYDATIPKKPEAPISPAPKLPEINFIKSKEGYLSIDKPQDIEHRKIVQNPNYRAVKETYYQHFNPSHPDAGRTEYYVKKDNIGRETPIQGVPQDLYLTVPVQKHGGWLQKYQKGGTKPPLYVDSKTDPRYIAYQDSLDVYNDYNNLKNKINKTGDFPDAASRGNDTFKVDLQGVKSMISKSSSWLSHPDFNPLKDFSRYNEGTKSSMRPIDVLKYPSTNWYSITAGLLPIYKKPTQEIKIRGEEDALLKKAKAMGWPTVEAYKNSGWKKGPGVVSPVRASKPIIPKLPEVPIIKEPEIGPIKSKSGYLATTQPTDIEHRQIVQNPNYRAVKETYYRNFNPSHPDAGKTEYYVSKDAMGRERKVEGVPQDLYLTVPMQKHGGWLQKYQNGAQVGPRISNLPKEEKAPTPNIPIHPVNRGYVAKQVPGVSGSMKTIYVNPETGQGVELPKETEKQMAMSNMARSNNVDIIGTSLLGAGMAKPAFKFAQAAIPFFDAPLMVGSTTVPGVTLGNVINAAGAGYSTEQILNPESDLRTNPNPENVTATALGFVGLPYKAGLAAMADDLGTISQFVTTQTPVKNAYKLRPGVLKENPDMYLYRARPVGQNPDMNMVAELKAREVADQPLTWWQKSLINSTDPRIAAREKYYGQWFEKDPSRLDFYINPGTRNFQDADQIELLRTKLPKSEAAKLNVSQFEDANLLSYSPETEFILPRQIINSAETFPESSLQQLIQEDKVFNTPHWWKGYSKTDVPQQLPGSPNTFNAVREYLSSLHPGAVNSKTINQNYKPLFTFYDRYGYVPDYSVGVPTRDFEFFNTSIHRNIGIGDLEAANKFGQVITPYEQSLGLDAALNNQNAINLKQAYANVNARMPGNAGTTDGYYPFFMEDTKIFDTGDLPRPLLRFNPEKASGVNTSDYFLPAENFNFYPKDRTNYRIAVPDKKIRNISNYDELHWDPELRTYVPKENPKEQLSLYQSQLDELTKKGIENLSSIELLDAYRLESEINKIKRPNFSEEVSVSPNSTNLQSKVIYPKANQPLPQYMEPYLGQVTKEISGDEKRFRSFLSPEGRAELEANDIIRYNPDGTIKRQYGGWLSKYQKAGQVPSTYDLMKVDITAPQESTAVVVPNIKNAPKKAEAVKQEAQRVKQVMKTTGAKSPAEVYAKEKEQAKLNEIAANQQSTLSPAAEKEASDYANYAWDIVSNPMTAAGYKVRGQNIPWNFTKSGERNVLDMPLDILNPAFYINTASRLGKAATEYDTYEDVAKTMWAGAKTLSGDTVYPDEKEAVENTLGLATDALVIAPGIATMTKYAKPLGELATTRTPLQYTYKINPRAKGSLFNPLEGNMNYRYVNQEGYNDALKNFIVRANPVGDNSALRRPTGFPSFAKGKPAQNFISTDSTPHYLMQTDIPMYARGEVNPVTGNVIKSSHAAARAIDPATGKALESLPLEDINAIYNAKPNWLKGYERVYQSPKNINVNTVRKGRNIANAGAFNRGVYELPDYPGYLLKYENPRQVASTIPEFINMDLAQMQQKIKTPNLGKVVKQEKIQQDFKPINAYVMRKVSGRDLSSLTIDELARIPQTSWKQYLKDVEEIAKNDLAIDNVGANVMYNPEDQAFKFIDLSPGVTPKMDPFWSNTVIGGLSKNLPEDVLRTKIKEGMLGQYDRAIDNQIFKLSKTFPETTDAGDLNQFITDITLPVKLKRRALERELKRAGYKKGGSTTKNQYINNVSLKPDNWLNKYQ